MSAQLCIDPPGPYAPEAELRAFLDELKTMPDLPDAQRQVEFYLAARQPAAVSGAETGNG